MSGMFVITHDDSLVEMNESAYDSENVLQALLAKYPNLLAGDQMDSANPRRWLLVAREAAVPGEENGAGRWSVDHLFLDQDGIPTLIEVKRSTDTRIRREVVGQMLDYAANAVVYWPVESIMSKCEFYCSAQGQDSEANLQEFLAGEAEPGEFWSKVKTNLAAGRIRMVFVADEIPPELQRVVEFLNTQMNESEVLAVQIKQYTGQGLRTLVPRVIGLIPEKPPSSGSVQWNEESFLAVLRGRGKDGYEDVARRLLGWAKENGPRIWWGKGFQSGSFYAMFDHNGSTFWTFGVQTAARNAYVELQFKKMKDYGPFESEEMRLELRERLVKIPDVSISVDLIDKYPSIRLSVLAKESSLKQFLEVMDWVVAEQRAAPTSAQDEDGGEIPTP